MPYGRQPNQREGNHMDTDPTKTLEQKLIADIHGIDTKMEKNNEENRLLLVERRSKEQELVKIYSQRFAATSSQDKHQPPNASPQNLDEVIQNVAFNYLMKADFCATKQILLAMERDGIIIDNAKPGNVVAGALQKRKDYFTYQDEIWWLKAPQNSNGHVTGE